VASHAAICSGFFPVAFLISALCAAWRGACGVLRRAAARRASWSWLHRAARAWLIECYLRVCLSVLVFFSFFLCPLRHDGALSSLSFMIGFSRGDLF
jgi:hypothetical protein